jgi:hypothetical protein
VYCRRCGYNLYRLDTDGACPECGLEVWESILHTVDPAASSLPRLRSPAAVGDGLFALIVCLMIGGLLLVLRPVAQWIDALDTTGIRNLAGLVPALLPVVAGVLGLVGLWWTKRLSPPAGEESGGKIWHDLRLLRGGTIAFSTLVIAVGVMQTAGVTPDGVGLVWLGVAAASIVLLLGLRGLLQIIGLRSREYRTAQGGRQGIKAMVAAIVGAALGQGLRLFGGTDLQTLGIALSAICTLMLLIGLVYLVVNVWWIRRSLHCPPPRLDEILGEET